MGNRRLFPTPPPLLHVPARQFPVTVHFSRRTELHDYVGAAHRKASKGLSGGACFLGVRGRPWVAVGRVA